MASASSPIDANHATPSDDARATAAQLRRVKAHIAELRRAGRVADAEAVAFVRDVAERALLGPRVPAAAVRTRRSIQPRELLTTGDAALTLGISDQTVRNWVAAGRLPAVKRGVRTMIPRQAVVEEIERSRVRPPQSPPSHRPVRGEPAAASSEEQTASTAWRRDLLGALPRRTVERLDALHERIEDGHALTTDEQAEMARLEREMADVAARHLQRNVPRGPSGAA